MTLFRVAKKPDGIGGMLLFLIAGRAGDGVVIGDRWFHFRRGYFVKDSARTLMRKPGYIVQSIGPATAKDVAHFNDAVGLPWGVRHNCVTTVTLYLATRAT